MKSSQIWLSPSQLGIFKDCQRCFWLHKRKLERPRGIFPSLPGGMDAALKLHYDGHRKASGLPKEIAKELEGYTLYPDQKILDKYRNWRTGPSTEIGEAKIGGAIDELLIDPEGRLVIFDYKTRGSAPPTTGEEYYGHQLDIYALLIYKCLGKEVAPEAILAYYYPSGTDEDTNGTTVNVSFTCELKRIAVSMKRAQEFIASAVACINGPIPEAAKDCEYCAFETARVTYQNENQPINQPKGTSK